MQFTRITTLVLVGALSLAMQAVAAPKKVLVVSVTTGFRHSSIETGEKVLAQLAENSGAFTLDFVKQPEGRPIAPRKPNRDKKDTDESFKAKEDAYKAELAEFVPANEAYNKVVNSYCAEKLAMDKIKGYDGFIFCNTTGMLPFPDAQGFIDLIKGGKAFIAMHSGTDTFHQFRPYIEMIGGEFDGHPWHQEVTVKNEQKAHPAGAPWAETFTVTDEIYQMKSYDRADKQVILSLDASNTQRPKVKTKSKVKGADGKEVEVEKELGFFERGKRTDGDYAVSWTRDFGKGRVFYTSLGHREEVWDPAWKDGNGKRTNSPEVAQNYQAHILGGIKWALGLAP
ncbi:MAG: ThuA domain-containing protein [Roseimicrobium sp.]